MKLTASQQRVVDLMGEGWALGISAGIGSRAWLQWGGLGRGGTTENVRITTFHALYSKGVIKGLGRKWPISEYVLTEQA